jgi:DNA replication and repair protein RecF
LLFSDQALLITGMPAARIRRLTVTNFRSYRAAQLEPDAGPVVLVGPNGSGKTNLIEAISFLTPGRGLRRATLEDIAFSEGDGSWAVSAEVEGALGLATLGTGIEPPANEDAVASRSHRRRPSPIICASFGWCRPWMACSMGRRRSAAAFSTGSRWRSMPSI